MSNQPNPSTSATGLFQKTPTEDIEDLPNSKSFFLRQLFEHMMEEMIANEKPDENGEKLVAEHMTRVLNVSRGIPNPPDSSDESEEEDDEESEDEIIEEEKEEGEPIIDR